MSAFVGLMYPFKFDRQAEILIAENEPAMRTGLSPSPQWIWVVFIAENGRKVLEAWEKGGIDVGMNGFLTKPMRIRDLEETINQLRALKQISRSRPLSSQKSLPTRHNWQSYSGESFWTPPEKSI